VHLGSVARMKAGTTHDLAGYIGHDGSCTRFQAVAMDNIAIQNLEVFTNTIADTVDKAVINKGRGNFFVVIVPDLANVIRSVFFSVIILLFHYLF
jgi:hypothetical protein